MYINISLIAYILTESPHTLLHTLQNEGFESFIQPDECVEVVHSKTAPPQPSESFPNGPQIVRCALTYPKLVPESGTLKSALKELREALKINPLPQPNICIQTPTLQQIHLDCWDGCLPFIDPSYQPPPHLQENFVEQWLWSQPREVSDPQRAAEVDAYYDSLHE